eukprot:141771-Chlamydomonas_euryale.AAC.5
MSHGCASGWLVMQVCTALENPTCCSPAQSARTVSPHSQPAQSACTVSLRRPAAAAQPAARV